MRRRKRALLTGTPTSRSHELPERVASKLFRIGLATRKTSFAMLFTQRCSIRKIFTMPTFNYMIRDFRHPHLRHVRHLRLALLHVRHTASSLPRRARALRRHQVVLQCQNKGIHSIEVGICDSLICMYSIA